jgi:hypothetical protein
MRDTDFGLWRGTWRKKIPFCMLTSFAHLIPKNIFEGGGSLATHKITSVDYHYHYHYHHPKACKRKLNSLSASRIWMF